MANIWFWLMIGAILVIAFLAYYAGRLVFQVRQQAIHQAQAEQLAYKALREHDAKIFTSVELICKAMLAKQCELSEGCWRISVLLESLKVSGSFRADYPSLFQLYDNIKHLAILEQRKQLSKQQRMQQDLQRLRYEEQLAQNITEELSLLVSMAEHEHGKLRHSLLH